jgi:hypothetical protein
MGKEITYVWLKDKFTKQEARKKAKLLLWQL